VKKRVVGEVAQGAQRSRALVRRIRELRLAAETKSRYTDRLASSCLCAAELACIENVVRFAEHVANWDKDVREAAALSADRDTRENLLRLQDDVKALKQWLAVPRTRLSQQQVSGG